MPQYNSHRKTNKKNKNKKKKKKASKPEQGPELEPEPYSEHETKSVIQEILELEQHPLLIDSKDLILDIIEKLKSEPIWKKIVFEVSYEDWYDLIKNSQNYVSKKIYSQIAIIIYKIKGKTMHSELEQLIHEVFNEYSQKYEGFQNASTQEEVRIRQYTLAKEAAKLLSEKQVMQSLKNNITKELRLNCYTDRYSQFLARSQEDWYQIIRDMNIIEKKLESIHEHKSKVLIYCAMAEVSREMSNKYHDPKLVQQITDIAHEIYLRNHGDKFNLTNDDHE